MLQIIGLTVAVYAMARLVQVPIEMSAGQESWLGTPFLVRFLIVAAISGVGVLIIGILALSLLFSGSNASLM